MEKTLTLEEIKSLRREFNTKVGDLIIEFYSKTGLAVTGINMYFKASETPSYCDCVVEAEIDIFENSLKPKN